MTRKLLNPTVLACLIGALIVALCLDSCHTSTDKSKSDIAGIIPHEGANDEVMVKEARYQNFPKPDTLIIYVDEHRFKVAADGQVFAPTGQKRFKLGVNGEIDRLFFLQMGNALFLFYNDKTKDAMDNYAERIDLLTDKSVWRRKISDGTMARPVVKGQFAYLSALGFVGKLKLKSGQYDWQQSNLNDSQRGKFEYFSEVYFPSSHEVMFVAKHLFSFEVDTVVINDISGEIIRKN